MAYWSSWHERIVDIFLGGYHWHIAISLTDQCYQYTQMKERISRIGGLSLEWSCLIKHPLLDRRHWWCLSNRQCWDLEQFGTSNERTAKGPYATGVLACSSCQMLLSLGFIFWVLTFRIAKTRMIGSQQRRLRCGEAKMKTIKMMRRRMTKTRRQRVAVVCHQVYIIYT